MTWAFLAVLAVMAIRGPRSERTLGVVLFFLVCVALVVAALAAEVMR